jgi:hypothetical protein
MVDKVLRTTLEDYLTLRLEKYRTLKPSGLLFITQKGSPYSPRTYVLDVKELGGY